MWKIKLKLDINTLPIRQEAMKLNTLAILRSLYCKEQRHTGQNKLKLINCQKSVFIPTYN